MVKFIVGARSDGIYEALHAAGVFKEDPKDVRRVIIDLEAGAPAKFYVEVYAEDTLIDVLMRGGIELVTPEAEAA